MADPQASVQELLERARRAAGPSSAASCRVRARVLAAIVPPPASGPTGAGGTGLGGLLASGAKILAVVAVTVTVGLRLTTAEPEPPRVPTAITWPVPTPPPAASTPPTPQTVVVGPTAVPEPTPATRSSDRERARSKPTKPSLADELASLAQVNDALARGDVDTATTHLRAHHTRFRAGQMRSEAMVLDILVATRAGRSVRAPCERFAAAFPGSLHDRRVASICAESGSDESR